MRESHTRIAFVTLGCAKNEVDTDKMQARLAAAGFSIVDDTDDADLVIVNTCAFLASAVEEGLEVIFDLVGRENAVGRELKVLVAGCMPARYGNDLATELVEAAGFLRRAIRDNVVEEVTQLLDGDVSLVRRPIPDTPCVSHDPTSRSRMVAIASARTA